MVPGERYETRDLLQRKMHVCGGNFCVAIMVRQIRSACFEGAYQCRIRLGDASNSHKLGAGKGDQGSAVRSICLIQECYPDPQKWSLSTTCEAEKTLRPSFDSFPEGWLQGASMRWWVNPVHPFPGSSLQQFVYRGKRLWIWQKRYEPYTVAGKATWAACMNSIMMGHFEEAAVFLWLIHWQPIRQGR